MKVVLIGDSRICLNKIDTCKTGKGLFADALEVAQMAYNKLRRRGVIMRKQWVPREQNTECDALTQEARLTAGVA